jgi:hypothetical protein
MCDGPFPAVLLLPAEVVGHNPTAVTQGMLDVDLGRDSGATYTRVTVSLNLMAMDLAQTDCMVH